MTISKLRVYISNTLQIGVGVEYDILCCSP